jgi:hypothetical protein
VGVVAIGVAWVPVSGQQAPAEAASTSADEPYRQILSQYCVGCHSTRAKTPATASGVVFDTADLSRIAANAGLWEKVLRKLHTRAMPPQGARRPDENSYHALMAWLRRTDRSARTRIRRPLRRPPQSPSTRTWIRDLLALDVDIAALLPPDDPVRLRQHTSVWASPSLQKRTFPPPRRSAVGRWRRPRGAGHRDVQRCQTCRRISTSKAFRSGRGGLVIHQTFPVDAEDDEGAVLPHQLRQPPRPSIRIRWNWPDGRRIRLATIGGDDDLNAAA